VSVRSRYSRCSILGCLIGGALGDAIGGVKERGSLLLSDDTQLTLATCESIAAVGRVDPEHLAATFLRWFGARRITGMGSATLKAMRDLQAGAHWALCGASGEMAAGNGAAMRIAPLAFVLDAANDRPLVRDVARITHRNEEAYSGALAVMVAIQTPATASARELLERVAAELPDSVTRDRLRQIAALEASASIGRIAAQFGASGYVADTVPLALLASWAVAHGTFAVVLDELVEAGGDTDTIASIAGQIAGSQLGSERLPAALLAVLPERALVEQVASDFAAAVGRD
jgi:ADP-ribosyl-[dinitrogen reductase] hydrolase